MKFKALCIKETGGDFFVSEDGENGKWRRANSDEEEQNTKTIRHGQQISRPLFFLVDDSGPSDWSFGREKGAALTTASPTGHITAFISLSYASSSRA